MKRFLAIFLLSIFFLSAGVARAYYNPGSPAGFVNDYAEILSTEERASLENKLSAFAAETSNEIALVTIKSLEGDTVENFAVKLFADWGIGSAKNDNGVLLLVAFEDRKMRIETGYGLEGALPDATAYQIMSRTLEPAFREADYYGGLDRATDEIIAATQGEYQAPVDSPAMNALEKFSFEIWFWIIIFIFYGLSALWHWLAKSKSWWQGGVGGAILGLVFALLFFQAFWWLGTLIFGGLGLLIDFLVSRVLPQPKPRAKGKGHFWWLGPGGGRSGGFGGGFGGFGGGRSGGGGVSGGW